MDDDILGRLNNVKMKLEAGNTEGAIEMTEHIKDMLDHLLDGLDGKTLAPISMAEIITRLNAALDDLEAFKTNEALERLKDLKGCDIPNDIRKELKKSIEYLKNYDDIEAKKIIENMVMFVNNNEDTTNNRHGIGYHSSRLS